MIEIRMRQNDVDKWTGGEVDRHPRQIGEQGGCVWWSG